MSTPATRRPMICAARTRRALVRRRRAGPPRSLPPRWTLLRNSSPCAARRIAATTRSPTTNARMSRPLLSATNFWMSTFCLALCSVSMIASATLIDVGEDHADALRALEQLDDDRRAADALDRGQDVRRGRARRPSAGMPMSWRLRICSERSLSREPRDRRARSSSEKTPICSNWRTTAVPKNGDRRADARDRPRRRAAAGDGGSRGRARAPRRGSRT